MKPQRTITSSELKQTLEYLPLTGDFISKVNRGKWKIGKIVGCARPDGYKKIKINGIGYLAHQLAFLYMTNSWVDLIDHIDRNPSNNCWSNLREATCAINTINTDLRADNTSGIKGVGWDKKNKKWLAQICVDGKAKNLGRFTDIIEAIKTRTDAEMTLR